MAKPQKRASGYDAGYEGNPSSGDSILSRGTRVRGRVQGEGSLVVEGHVQGDVAVSGDLTIGAEGGVVGDVEAGSVVIDGELEGDVTARGSVAIRAGARVRGNMGGVEVALDEGASFTGRIDAEFDFPEDLGKPAAPIARRR
jgi:cytoskeletal protein CcmA (bactofilin family)